MTPGCKIGFVSVQTVVAHRRPPEAWSQKTSNEHAQNTRNPIAEPIMASSTGLKTRHLQLIFNMDTELKSHMIKINIYIYILYICQIPNWFYLYNIIFRKKYTCLVFRRQNFCLLFTSYQGWAIQHYNLNILPQQTFQRYLWIILCLTLPFFLTVSLEAADLGLALNF